MKITFLHSAVVCFEESDKLKKPMEEMKTTAVVVKPFL